jgi:hypothetical protein
MLENFKTSDDTFRLTEIFERMNSGKITVNTDLIQDKQIIRNVLDGIPFGGVVWCAEDMVGNKRILFKQTYFNTLLEFYNKTITLECDLSYDEIPPIRQSRFDDTNFTFRTIWYHPDLKISDIKNKIEHNGG